MFNFFNTNPPQVRKNTEKTLKRLENINKKLEAVTTGLKLSGGGIISAGALAGLSFGGIVGIGFGGLAGMAVAVPLVTAAMILPVAAQNVVKSKIDSLRKKLANPIPHIIDLQKQKTEKLTKKYNSTLLNKESTLETINTAKNDLETQQKRQDVFVKAAERAKEEGKEATIGRLMDIVQRAESGDSFTSGFETIMQGAYSAASVPLAHHMFGQMKEHAQKIAEITTEIASSPDSYTLWKAKELAENPPHSNTSLAIVGAVAAVSVAATAYCAYQTVKYYKREKAADKSFKLLDAYAQGRQQ